MKQKGWVWVSSAGCLLTSIRFLLPSLTWEALLRTAKSIVQAKQVLDLLLLCRDLNWKKMADDFVCKGAFCHTLQHLTPVFRSLFLPLHVAFPISFSLLLLCLLNTSGTAASGPKLSNVWKTGAYTWCKQLNMIQILRGEKQDSNQRE